jgi:probable F420-dependent oxidoreductase
MLAGVGPLMPAAAGEVADGMFCHGFSTERYVREVTLPALERGAEKAGRTLDDFEISAPSMIVAADSDEELEAGIGMVRSQIGFYGSTPAYRPVLELHGWADLQDELNALTKRGAWDQIGSVIDDDVLHAFAIVGTPEEAIEEARRRYGDLCSRVSIPVPDGADPDRWAGLFERLREPVTA